MTYNRQVYIITQTKEKIKDFVITFREELGVSLVVVLVGISSFLLGRLSTSSPLNQSQITIEDNPISAPEVPSIPQEAHQASGKIEATQETTGQVIASKSGKRYYFPWCGGVSRIKEANKVYFGSPKEAEARGLTLASGCK